MKFKLLLYALLCTCVLQAQTAIEGDFKLIKNMTIKGKAYTIYVKSNPDEFQFKVKLLGGNEEETTEYKNGIDSNKFFNLFALFIQLKFDQSLVIPKMTDVEKIDVIQLIADIQIIERKKSDATRDELENILFAIENEKDQYSAKLVLNESIPFSDLPSNGGNRTFATITNQTTQASRPELKIIDAKITFFNNKASSIYIKAELTENGVPEKIIFINNDYSVALRYFNRYGATVTSKRKDKSDIAIDYNDVFDYESDQNFNYSIANSQVSLSNVKDSKIKPYAKLIQRRFFDYFTAVVYSDLMGFNTENSNPLLNAQARLLIPLNLKNSDILFSKPGKWTMFRQFYVNTSIALTNSFENENRFISVVDTADVSNFELFKRNNLYGEFGLDFLTHEAKGWFLNISLGYKAKFYRTGFRYTQTQENTTDMVTNKQIISIGHGPFLNFEIRPQNNFGADVTLSLEDLNFTDSNTIADRTFKDDIITEAGREHFLVPYNIISLNASFYWLTNPEKAKGGIYANLGGFYHTESKSLFPQFMVGYATNLTSFVNRFKPKQITEVVKEE